MKIKRYLPLAVAACVGAASLAGPRKNVVDEVIWIVGDQAIFRSDVEDMYAQMRSEGTPIEGDPYCVIPERLAVEKLYLHQARLDTVEAPESTVQGAVDRRIAFFEANLGSKEKVEEYFRKPLPALKEQLVEIMKNNYVMEQVQANLTKNVKPTPNAVKKYFSNLPEDSIPFIPMQVETQVIQLIPAVPKQEIEDIKARLRDYADRVNRGEANFSSLAILHSEDGSAMQGGELGYHNRADFVPEFSNVAFNLSDPNKVSQIVETEYGYHIIQLIDKRGDQVNVRHILLRPKVSTKDLTDATMRLDSIRKEIVAGTFSFEEAARLISQDKDSRNNKGIMVNPNNGSARFEMQDLPAEVAAKVQSMKPGDISEPFIMKDPAKNQDVVVIIRLTNRIDGHRASMQEDYNLIKKMYEEWEKDRILKQWVEKKIKDTYIHIEDGWADCDFVYDGWLKK